MRYPSTAGRAAPVLAVALFAAFPAAGNGVADVYYERALMSAADARCGLFSADTAAALGAAKAQARGAALRSGLDEAGLQAVGARAQARAQATRCDAPGLRLAAGRVRDAFKAYAGLQRMSFPGDGGGWTAVRVLPTRAPAWRLSQSVRLDGEAMIFGLAGTWGAPQQLLAVADLGDEAPPYAARMVMRDAGRSPRAYLGSSRTPPRWSAKVFQAEARSPADGSLRPAGARAAVAFRFPAAAAEAMAGLDPREAVTVELLYAGRAGDTVRTAFVEVGDFAAGRAFLTASVR